MTILTNGVEVPDGRLDRLVQFDERSRNYPIRTAVPNKPRSYTWRLEAPYLIDQGREGACVGFSIANELMARPSEVNLGSNYNANMFAKGKIYWEAQKIDPWAGGAYPGADPWYHGTSVLAGIKVAHRLGYFDEYRWAFGLADLIYGVGHNGPAVIGVPWYDTNYRPDADGFIWAKGNVVGGHAVLVRAVKCVFEEGSESDEDYSKRNFGDLDLDESYFTIRNSWGVWGHEGSGDCFMTFREMDKYLKNQGEAVFVINRKTDPE